MTTVADVMNPEPVSIDAASPVSAAARMMMEHHIGMLPVVRNGVVVGIVTDRDLVLRVLAADHSATGTLVGEVASDRVVSVAPETPLDELELLIEERRVRRVPVVSEGTLVGVVSQSDIARVSPHASPHMLEGPQVWLE